MIFDNISFKDFQKKIKKNGLICFGVGSAFENFFIKLKQFGLEKYIIYAIDNDKEKWNNKKMGNKRFEIFNPNVLKSNFKSGTCLLITSRNLKDILLQLCEYDELRKEKCYYYGSILDEYYNDNIHLKEVSRNIYLEQECIPKKIHYCWFGKNAIPDKYKKWMESWRKYCPDYQILEWNENNYDITKNKYMKEAYEMKKWGFVPDYARLDIIYEHGGIYLDTDVEVLKNLDQLLYQEAFCGFQHDLRVAFGLGFGAVQGLPIIKNLRDQYDEISFIDKDGKPNLIASPTYQTNFLVKKGLKLNGEFQVIERLNIYPATYFCGLMGYGGKNITNEKSYSIHHFSASWVEDEELNKIKDNLNIIKNNKLI